MGHKKRKSNRPTAFFCRSSNFFTAIQKFCPHLFHYQGFRGKQGAHAVKPLSWASDGSGGAQQVFCMYIGVGGEHSRCYGRASILAVFFSLERREEVEKRHFLTAGPF
jgi:hypothetical protein